MEIRGIEVLDDAKTKEKDVLKVLLDCWKETRQGVYERRLEWYVERQRLRTAYFRLFHVAAKLAIGAISDRNQRVFLQPVVIAFLLRCNSAEMKDESFEQKHWNSS
jgi:hypothetical protein